ncbi:MAG: hybrid sensor histidine kinase/response regulator, partial [Verrucomicrobiota bacterium]
MGGQEAVRQIHRIDPEIKLILSSGYNEESLNDDTRNAIVGFLQKPFEGDALKKMLTRLYG